jgi:hypothetical protein
MAYLPFKGEQHGFRRSENIKRALEAELYFYSKVFSFELSDPVKPVTIQNIGGDVWNLAYLKLVKCLAFYL